MRLSKNSKKHGQQVQTYDHDITVTLTPDEQFIVFDAVLDAQNLLEFETQNMSPQEKGRYMPRQIMRRLIEKLESQDEAT